MKLSPGEWIKAEVDRGAIGDYVEKTFKPNLRRLLDIHRRNGEAAVFASQPANPLFFKRERDTVFVAHPQLARWAVALHEINSATGALCHEEPERCRFIDLAQAIVFEPADFYDLVHYTPSGARKIGEFLSRELDFVKGVT
jgi:hypothetical protein